MNMRTVTNTAELQAAIAEGVGIREIEVAAAVVAVSQAELDAARKAGRQEALDAAIQAERARIQEIQSLAPPKHEELIATAISSGMDPGTFSMIVLREHKQEAPSA